LLTSATISYYSARLQLANPAITTEAGDIDRHQVGLTVTRIASEGVHEELDVTNYSLGPVKFNLEIALRSDFADIFEVKAHRFTRRGRTTSRWDPRRAELSTANEDVYRTYRQSVDDMGALRLYDDAPADDVWVPAAGVPWFVTLFGRDSLIVSLQNVMVHASFALGALTRLAELQATARDDWRDAQPGKIMHELRRGELTHFNKIPYSPYYGTADATILYLIVLHEAWKWLGDRRLLRRFRPVAERCLEWIDRHGDLDGDGFQEYR